MHFTLSTAANSGQASNTIYPHQQAITNAQELEQAVRYDHVCGQFQNNQRTIANFIKADCLIMDCDTIRLLGSTLQTLLTILMMFPTPLLSHATT